ncbi:hypothetical protein POM88_001458 [Heracleum sosnowskyi]|uniref:Uncharacterized protein n=1 Tax=Heracleum sosnowskyi TaxID=360622 RepID=A0AAD8NBP9_9APIA|nr:hypothetical protein POM88_001458 [Heracleum sosnowskyi]
MLTIDEGRTTGGHANPLVFSCEILVRLSSSSLTTVVVQGFHSKDSQSEFDSQTTLARAVCSNHVASVVEGVVEEFRQMKLHPTSSYANQWDEPYIKKWQTALQEAADLAGHHLRDEDNGNEYKFIQKLVSKVLPQVNSKFLILPDNLVGIGSRVSSVNQLLNISNLDVLTIGIYGMVGIDLNLKNLVMLDMSYSKIIKLWLGFKQLEQLRILDLSFCEFLVETPNFTGVQNIERLILKGCRRLKKLHPSIVQLFKLCFFDFDYSCECGTVLQNRGHIHLEQWPEDFQNMDHLDLRDCRALLC